MLLQAELFSNLMAEVDMQHRTRAKARVRTVQLVVLQLIAATQRNALCAVQQAMRKSLQNFWPGIVHKRTDWPCPCSGQTHKCCITFLMPTPRAVFTKHASRPAAHGLGKAALFLDALC